jgi:orotidine-5'-phosphate decarboxylase
VSDVPFADRLAARVVALESVLCVGLDPRAVPDDCRRGLRADRAGQARAVERYCLGLVEAVEPYAAADRVCAAARAAGLLVIVDGKRGDIDSTAAAYAAAWLAPRLGEEAPVGDALTVSPYLGGDATAPFLAACDRHGAGLYVLTRTSNPGAADLQELPLAGGGSVWERVAAQVAGWGAGRIGAAGLASVGAVVGLTAPEAVRRARAAMPAAPLLLPGLGAQGGAPVDASAAFVPHPAGGLVASARAIIEAWQGAAGPWREAVGSAARSSRDALRPLAF